MKIGIVGLQGKLLDLAFLIRRKGHFVVAYDPKEHLVYEAVNKGIEGAFSVSELIEKINLKKVRSENVYWMSLFGSEELNKPYISEFEKNLAAKDIIVDISDVFYKESIRRSKEYEKIGVEYLDTKLLGNKDFGYGFFVGGREETFFKLKKLFEELSNEKINEGRVIFIQKPGAGHFIGFIYELIKLCAGQSYSEAIDILKNSEYDIDLTDVLSILGIFTNEEQITSDLIDAFEKHGTNLIGIDGSVGTNKKTGQKDMFKEKSLWLKNVKSRLKVNTKVLDNALDTVINNRSKKNFQYKIMKILDK